MSMHHALLVYGESVGLKPFEVCGRRAVVLLNKVEST